MASRRNNTNRIRGPQSALTDFLAANNISAAQIRDNYARRQRETAAETGADGEEEQAINDPEEEVEEQASRQNTAQTSRKRKRDTVKEKEKGKKKKKKGGADSDNEYNEIAGDMYRKSKPKPGQLENCEICSKRFTVTPYTKTGPDGNLLCAHCGKLQTKDEKKSARDANKKAGTGQKRRKQESNRLDGLVHAGPKSLQQLCIEKVAENHLDLEEFGDLPDNLLDRLSEIFSKKRVLDPRTLQLFLRSDLHRIAINDAANLETDDYDKIFAFVPGVRQVIFRNAGQYKDSSLRYMIEKAVHIDYLQLYATNLVSNDAWQDLFMAYGEQLKTVKLQWLDAAFTDDVVKTMVESCPNIERLKLKYCRKLTSTSLAYISRLQNLQHLSLHTSSPVTAEELTSLIESLGPQLRTLSLENFVEVDDSVIDAIRNSCQMLSKLRITDVDGVTDPGLASLFNAETSVVPPLRFIDLSSTRDLESSEAAELPVGLCSEAFRALASHSSSKLQTLMIASCRHISHAALCDAFNPRLISWPELIDLNVSFVNDVDTSVIRAIFSSSPVLTKVIAFGCFKIEDVVVPSGIALIGVPKAQDAIEQIGETGMNLTKALGIMDRIGGTGHGVIVESMA